MAVCTIAIMRCAMYGLVPPRLAIGVTALKALSSQSVMPLAKEDGAAVIITTVTNPLQRREFMTGPSELAALRVNELLPQSRLGVSVVREPRDRFCLGRRASPGYPLEAKATGTMDTRRCRE